MNRIGLDAHSATFTMAVMNEAGKVTRCLSRPTSAENLIELVSAVPGPKELIVEESAVAQWVKETLEPYVDALIVCDPRQNRWIAKAEFNDDRTSAIKLADLRRGGYIKEIRHLDGDQIPLRQSFLHYADLNKQITRFKSKLKATFRQAGIDATGDGIYEEESHREWLARLDSWPALRRQAEHLFVLVDEIEQMKQESLRGMVKAARKRPGYDLLVGMPGAGPVVGCGYVALIGTPHRFSRRNKLWKYGGYSKKHRDSDGRIYQDGSSRSGNRVLKWVVGQHFIAAVHRTQKPNVFKSRYERLCRQGDERVARRVVCRSLLSVARAIWMKGEPYREMPLKK